MNKSDSIKEIAAALVKAQAAIKGAVKDATNPHFRSKYADLTSVIDAVKDALNTNGITFLQPVTFSDEGVSVETVLMHSSGEWISEKLAVPVSKHDAQGVGSAISYGRRYGLQAMCGVPSEDDDGNDAVKHAPAKPAAKPVLAPDVEAVSVLEACGSLDALTAAWKAFPADEREALKPIAAACKARILEAEKVAA
jgi:hypothetical protein